MKNKILIFGGIIILAFVAIFLSIPKETVTEQLPATENKSEEQSNPDTLKSLAVKHQYKDGRHIFVGDVEVPTPCHSLEVKITDTDNPNIKNINISSKQDEEVEICAQVISKKTFKIEYEGAENLEFDAFVDGVAQRLNIFDLEPEEDIDKFELFIKG